MKYLSNRLVMNIKKCSKLYAILSRINRMYLNLKIWIWHFKNGIGAFIRGRGYNDKKYSRIKQLKNVHKDQRCFIVCTGPSLTLGDVEKLEKEITFGVNSIVKLYNKTIWRPTYYGIIDVNVYNKIKNEDISFRKYAFISDLFLKKVKKPTFTDFMVFPMDAFELLRKSNGDVHFSNDIYKIVYDVATVVYSMLQIAVYMGFKEIYLLGCDCDYSGEKQHFSEYGMDVRNNPESEMVIAYTAAKQYADAHGIKIYNATRGGKLEVFERVDFDSLFPPEDSENNAPKTDK